VAGCGAGEADLSLGMFLSRAPVLPSVVEFGMCSVSSEGSLVELEDLGEGDDSFH